MDDKIDYWIVDMIENLGAAMYEKQMFRSYEATVELQLLAINEIHRTSRQASSSNKPLIKSKKPDESLCKLFIV